MRGRPLAVTSRAPTTYRVTWPARRSRTVRHVPPPWGLPLSPHAHLRTARHRVSASYLMNEDGERSLPCHLSGRGQPGAPIPPPWRRGPSSHVQQPVEEPARRLPLGTPRLPLVRGGICYINHPAPPPAAFCPKTNPSSPASERSPPPHRLSSTGSRPYRLDLDTLSPP